ncbi:MAG: V-type ATPase subunit [Clostridiales bacterium]|nr:V-type ATPase subunit [Clostridiales bacterium]
MGRVVDFTAINAKIKAMEGFWLKKSQYKELIECNNFREALIYLRDKTKYGDTLKEYNVEELHRGQLEVILKRKYISNFTKLSHFLRDDYRKLLKVIFTRFEVDDIKVIIRGKYIGKRTEDLEQRISYKCSMSTINYDELLQADNVEQVVDKLKGTIYYKYIYNLVDSIEDDGLFRIEMALDSVYFILLKRFIKKLPKEDKEVVEKINGIQADLLNIQMIYRGLKYYQLPSEILFNYAVQDGCKLKKDDLKRLCYSKNIDDFLNKIKTTAYKEIFNISEFEDYLLEKEMMAFLQKLYTRYKTEAKMNISVILAYLELSLIEYRNIVSIVENKRYSQHNDEIIKYITTTM